MASASATRRCCAFLRFQTSRLLRINVAAIWTNGDADCFAATEANSAGYGGIVRLSVKTGFRRPSLCAPAAPPLCGAPAVACCRTGLARAPARVPYLSLYLTPAAGTG